ncbi:F-box protein At5g03100-like [Quercus robur]|uniref:F-box protein At5g03100-like n=2 Tax=Quercus TaxID=3511 RepID=UPI0021636478|nr:F-box protein At5g03100-like [Quercus robur]
MEERSNSNCVCTKRHNLDRISDLPDSILHHILSFLPTEEAIEASYLSKRWNWLWTFASGLSFYDHQDSEHVTDLAVSVCKTLPLYRSHKLDKFHITDFRYTPRFECYVDYWVNFATTHNVENLYLELDSTEMPYYDQYRLSQSLCTHSSLKTLALRFCKFEPKPCIRWTSLKVLCIAYARLTRDMIRKILLGSPALTDLRLYNFEFQGKVGKNVVTINSTSLQKLELDGGKDLCSEDFSVVVILAPNLRSLSISGLMYRRRFRLRNVSSLVEAKLSFERTMTDHERESCYSKNRSVLTKLLVSLLHVPKITISTWCLQVLSLLTILEVKALPSPLAERKCLVLDTELNKWDLPGITNLLQSSPDLEKLVVNLVPSCNSKLEFKPEFINDYNFDHEEFWNSKRTFECLSLHLKTVEIVGFEAKCFGLPFVLGFVQFLLKHARVLEKMVIYEKREATNQTPTLVEAREFLQVTQLILSYQKSSPNAVVMFS